MKTTRQLYNKVELIPLKRIEWRSPWLTILNNFLESGVNAAEVAPLEKIEREILRNIIARVIKREELPVRVRVLGARVFLERLEEE